MAHQRPSATLAVDRIGIVDAEAPPSQAPAFADLPPRARYSSTVRSSRIRPLPGGTPGTGHSRRRHPEKGRAEGSLLPSAQSPSGGLRYGVPLTTLPSERSQAILSLARLPAYPVPQTPAGTLAG